MIVSRAKKNRATFVTDQAEESALPLNSTSFGRRTEALTRPGTNISTATQAGDTGNQALAFIQDNYYWSPARIFRFLSGISIAIPQQTKIFRVMRSPVYKDFRRTDSRFQFKFLIRDYLARDFSTIERAECFLAHYECLQTWMSAELLRETLFEAVTVFETQREDLRLEVQLGLSRPFEKEGELSLNLLVNGTIVFVLSFTIIPGHVVKSNASRVLLISRLQGTNGYYPQIRRATKAMDDVGPVAQLLAALHGFGMAFNIDQMAVVSASRQSTYSDALSSSYRSAYDGFFTEIDIPQNDAGFFLSSIPPAEKPISSVKHGHKIRTRKKRQVKLELADCVCQRLYVRLNHRSLVVQIP